MVTNDRCLENRLPMNLQGLSVLIDGYNLGMTNGTGIKAYTISLIQALNYLGANVSVLFGKPTTGNPILDEVLFFQSQSENLSKLCLLKSAFKYLVNSHREAQILKLTDKVVVPDERLQKVINSVEVLNSNDCYTTAKVAYHLFGGTTTITLPKTKKINIWHKTYPIIPINVQGCGDIVTIHDLVPLKLPHTTKYDKNLFYKAVKSVIQQSKVIITVSENTKQDILDFYDVNPDKIHVTYQALTQTPLHCSDAELSFFLKRYNLKPQKYILFVGAIEPKKNIGRLIEAFAGMDTDLKLVIVGKKAWFWQKEIGNLESIFGSNWSERVRILDYVNNESLKYLYKGAFCFIFPSIYEGFGIPPLEAMTFECPVITSKTSSLSEVCGDAALYVDPYDTDDIRKGIERLVYRPELRNKLIDAGKERVKFFSMENYAKRLYHAYAKVV